MIKKNWTILIIFITLLLLAFFILFSNGHKRENVVSTANSINDGKEISVKEAYNIALKRAKEWDKNAELYFLTSVDDSSNESSKGIHGKRRYWNINFVVPSQEKQVLISISDKKITNFIEGTDKIPESSTIYSNELVLDSPEILQKSKKLFELKPGQFWAEGYHFALDKFEGQVYLTVVGLNKDNYFTKIIWDPKNGDVLEAIEKLPNGGGAIVINNDLEKQVFNTEGEVNGIAISEDENKVLLWGNNFVNQVSPPSYPFVKFSKDRGKSWYDFNLPNKEVIDAWFTAKDELYIATKKDLYFSSGNKKLKPLLNVSSEIVDLHFDHNKIVILTKKSAYISNNFGNAWSSIQAPQNTKSVVFVGEHLFILTNDGDVLYRNTDKWDNLTQATETVISINNYKNGIILSYLDGKIKTYDVVTEKWEITSINHRPSIKFILSTEANHYFYTISSDGGLYKHTKGWDNFEWIIKPVFIPKEGMLTAFLPRKDNSYLTLTPTFNWEDMEMGDK